MITIKFKFSVHTSDAKIKHICDVLDELGYTFKVIPGEKIMERILLLDLNVSVMTYDDVFEIGALIGQMEES